jgi:hypothetical protein
LARSYADHRWLVGHLVPGSNWPLTGAGCRDGLVAPAICTRNWPGCRGLGPMYLVCSCSQIPPNSRATGFDEGSAGGVPGNGRRIGRGLVVHSRSLMAGERFHNGFLAESNSSDLSLIANSWPIIPTARFCVGLCRSSVSCGHRGSTFQACIRMPGDGRCCRHGRCPGKIFTPGWQSSNG